MKNIGFSEISQVCAKWNSLL